MRPISHPTFRTVLRATVGLTLALSALSATALSAQEPDRRALQRAQDMVRARADAGRVATEMSRSFRQTPAQISTILRRVSFSAAQAAPALVSTLGLRGRDAAGHMVRGGYQASETTRSLLRASVSAAEIAAGLGTAGVQPEEVAGSLRVARVGGAEATRALKGAGLAGETAAVALLGGGYEPIDIRDALDAEFTTVSVPFLARAMAYNGNSATEVAAAMATSSRSFAQALAILVQVGFQPVESGAALLDQSVYGSVPVGEVAQALSNGQDISDSALLATLQSVLETSRSRTPMEPIPAAELQRDFGVSTVSAFGALGQVFDLSGIEVFHTAREAGYSPAELAEGSVQAFDLLLEEIVEELVSTDAEVDEIVITVLAAEARGGRSEIASAADGVVQAIEAIYRVVSYLVGNGLVIADYVEASLSAGVPARSITEGMLAGGADPEAVLESFSDPIGVLGDVLRGFREAGVGFPDAAAALAGIPIDGADAAPVLRNAWQVGEETVATTMMGAGYSTAQVALGLQAMEVTPADIVRILRNQGTSLEEVTETLDQQLDLTAQAIAQALHDARVVHTRILQILTQHFQLKEDEARAIIDRIR